MNYNLIIFLFISNILFANVNENVTTNFSGEDIPPPSLDDFRPPDGPGIAPINDYAGLLIVSGFIAATAIYFRKEQLIKKNK